MQNLAGLTRIEYVFVFLKQNDIVLARPPRDGRSMVKAMWSGGQAGQPVLQLDDLIVALRTAKSAATDRGISCSMTQPTRA